MKSRCPSDLVVEFSAGVATGIGMLGVDVEFVLANIDADDEPILSVDFFVDLGYVGHGKPPFQ